MGGYEYGHIVVDTTISLSEEKWKTFISLVDQAEFWKMTGSNYSLGNDGATWLLEGLQGTKYHWVDKVVSK